jgi:hypothetical protein
LILKNIEVNIEESYIYNELLDLKFEITSVTRLQNRFKNPLSIVTIFLSEPSIAIFSLNILLHCAEVVKLQKPSKNTCSLRRQNNHLYRIMQHRSNNNRSTRPLKYLLALVSKLVVKINSSKSIRVIFSLSRYVTPP